MGRPHPQRWAYRADGRQRSPGCVWDWTDCKYLPTYSLIFSCPMETSLYQLGLVIDENIVCAGHYHSHLIQVFLCSFFCLFVWVFFVFTVEHIALWLRNWTLLLFYYHTIAAMKYWVFRAVICQCGITENSGTRHHPWDSLSTVVALWVADLRVVWLNLHLRHVVLYNHLISAFPYLVHYALCPNHSLTTPSLHDYISNPAVSFYIIVKSRRTSLFVVSPTILLFCVPTLWRPFLPLK